jgi:hypothetical protein
VVDDSVLVADALVVVDGAVNVAAAVVGEEVDDADADADDDNDANDDEGSTGGCRERWQDAHKSYLRAEKTNFSKINSSHE